MNRILMLILVCSQLLLAQQISRECNQKAGVTLGFPDVINLKYQYYLKNNIYLGGISIISLTNTFGKIPLNLPSFCIGYELFKGKTINPGIEMVTTFWVWDQVMQGYTSGDTAFTVHANHLILTMRPYLSIGKSWGINLTGGISYIKNWYYEDKHGYNDDGFYSKKSIYPSFAFYLWFAFY